MSVKSYMSKSPDLVGTLTATPGPSMGWRNPILPATVLAMAAAEKEAGERLQALREQKGWSRETLAYHANVSTKTVERIEKGSVEGRRGTIQRIATALDVDEYVILGEPRGPDGVPLSNQLTGVSTEFRGRVDQVEERLARIELAVAQIQQAVLEAVADRAQHHEEIRDLIATQLQLLHDQSELLATIQSTADGSQSIIEALKAMGPFAAREELAGEAARETTRAPAGRRRRAGG